MGQLLFCLKCLFGYLLLMSVHARRLQSSPPVLALVDTCGCFCFKSSTEVPKYFFIFFKLRFGSLKLASRVCPCSLSNVYSSRIKCRCWNYQRVVLVLVFCADLKAVVCKNNRQEHDGSLLSCSAVTLSMVEPE